MTAAEKKMVAGIVQQAVEAALAQAKAGTPKAASPKGKKGKTFLGKAARNQMRADVGIGHNGKTLAQATKAQKTACRAWLKAHGYDLSVATKLGF